MIGTMGIDRNHEFHPLSAEVFRTMRSLMQLLHWKMHMRSFWLCGEVVSNGAGWMAIKIENP